MAVSTEQFLDRIGCSGVLSSTTAQALLDALPEPERPVDAEGLARWLVKQKKLTAYQAKQIYAGKGKSLVLGNYVVLDKLGQGGMGLVFKAEHRRMERVVALKVLSPTVTETREAVQRFQREVKAAARLEHPNIVTAYDADEAGGTHFLVMQYVDGQDLSNLIRTRGVLPVDQAVQCVLQAARGLDYAHQRGIVHRDIKPSNLLLARDGTVKVLDMGLARIEGETGAQAELTSTGAVMGTVDYMAPEQALSTKYADARSDVYSLGMTLWYLLVGKPAYEGDSLMARLLAHREGAIPALRDVRPEAGEALEDVFRRMVAKRPEDRFPSMLDVVAALQRCLRDEASVPTAELRHADDGVSAVWSGTQGIGARAHAATVVLPNAAHAVTAGSAFEATVTSNQPEVPTDPQTLTHLVAAHSSKGKLIQRAARRNMSGRRNRSVLIGTGGAALATVAVMIVVSRGDRTARSRPGDDVTATASTPGRDSKRDVEVPANRAYDAARLAPAAIIDPAHSAPSVVPAVQEFALDFGADLPNGNPRVQLPFGYPEDYRFTVEMYATLRSLAPARTYRGVIFSNELQLKQTARGLELMHVLPDKSLDLIVFDDLKLGRRVNLTIVGDGTELMLFIDGERVGTTRLQWETEPRSFIVVGSLHVEDPKWFPFDGTIDELRISDVARYSGDFMPPPSYEPDGDTMALYQFDEGSGTVLRDVSGNGRDGTIVGAKWVLRSSGVATVADRPGLTPREVPTDSSTPGPE